ncbi:flagellar filament capping protein FliD [Sporomusa sp. KB1]|uniref:flagellar filament capping protein FliD n=1 Tax=Sporomusa sp. KB1 TaxID=943346 RepID=UPI0011A1B3A9|nr:flagellar filament capping protein FliD [Sporomusa sp. KB1]TWH45237.1 flagellar hook-associated protein 2 [Sporomusa sp. KB1]
MTSSVSGSSANRVYGLSGSGMDVDAMVEKLMTAARQPYTKMTQKQTLVEWKKEAYNTLYTSINTFRNDKVFNFGMKSTLAAKSVTSSNSSVASVTASGDAINVNHTLKVSQLASGVTQSSTEKITTGTSKNTLASQFGINGSFNIKINGKDITVSSTQSINDLVSNINKSGAGVTAAYDTTQDRFYLYTNGTGSETGIDYTGTGLGGLNFLNNSLKMGVFGNIGSTGITSSADTGITAANKASSLQTAFSGLTGSFNLKISDGTTTSTIAVDTSTDTMDSIIAKINAIKDSSGNSIADAQIDTTTGKFTLKAKNDGEELSLTGSDYAGISFLNNQLKLSVKQQGQDAEFKLDGTTMTQTTNKFTVAGVTYNLQSTGTSTIGIQTDTDKIVSSVKKFIEDYNTILSSINTKVSEKRDTDYMPLTDDQKEAMSDDDEKIWTEKVKTGLLHNDSTLQTLANSMRNVFASKVPGLTGKYTSASSLGISTSVDYTENGKLYLDEDKLKAALQEDPDIVYKIFGTDSATDKNDGIAVKLSAMLKTASDGIVKQAGITASTKTDITSVLGKQYKEYTTQLTALNKKLIAMENQYYTKFNAMEEALSKISQQSSYVTSLLGTSS